jgi:anti-sigma regulatory factor (Ser/Thr protein kinase)
LREGQPVTYELALEPTVEAVGAGRRMVSAALSDWDLDGLSYTATLLTSEVLTNSVLHARTPILLTIERTGTGAVTISVRDGSKFVPRRRRHAREATTGRGLELLDRLAQSWRVQTEGDGKTISFVVGGDIDPWAAYAGVDWMDAEL